jgi:SCY1-like protein 2
VIPFLVPLSIENGLSLNQFNAIMALVKDMIARVEGEHRTKLEQLSNIQKENNALKFESQTQLVPNAKSPNKSASDEAFANLGLEQFLNDMEEGGNDSNVGMSSMSTSSSSMSLQEKQRMVQQQELNQRLQSQGTITPKAAPLKIANKPKDLSTSLLENNLTQLKLTHSTSNNNNNWFNTSNNSWGSPASNNNTITTPSQKKNDDWGAFEDLVPNSSKKKTPMNQMKNSASQPLNLMQHANSSSSMTNRKKTNDILSADDIMEFLK